ncbi:MAG: DUF6261 family protein, partial [Prevotellaceae bacterium]|nr:DUF6261 family protein [Prevotellaceae bacterium]
MVQFKVLKFSVLPNEAHANYANNAIETFEDAGEVVVVALGQLLNEFKDWCALENIGIHWVRKDALTVLIVAADKDMDRALVGLLKYVRSLRYSSQPGFSAAAERVIIMLDGYGRVYEKAYEAQEGAVNAILWQFANTYAEDANLLSLGAWIADLTSTFEKFKLLLAQRDVHSLEKPTMPFKQVRKGLEGSYHKIVKIINAAALLGLQPEFAVLINRLNPEIDRLNAEFHRAKHDIAHAE